jgi:hypothetical protein
LGESPKAGPMKHKSVTGAGSPRTAGTRPAGSTSRFALGPDRPWRLSLLLGLSSVLVVVLMASPASAVPPAVVKTPPFTGASPFAQHHDSRSSASCGYPSILVVPRADLSTGKVVSKSLVSEGARHNPLGRCSGQIASDAGFTGPAFTVTTTGAHSITFAWQVSWNVSASVFGHFCLCSILGWKISLFANVFDNTTGSWVLGGSSPNNRVSVVANCSLRCSLFGGYSSGTLQNYSLIAKANLTSGDQYLLFTGLKTSASASGGIVFTSQGTSTYSSTVDVDVGSHQRGAWLKSVNVS